MIGFFYDDYLHILNACQRLETASGTRPLLSLFYCYIGQNPFIVRMTSLICIFLTVVLISKILNKLRVHTDKNYYFLIMLHSSILFPFFYSSQLSTSSTFLWAIATTYLLLFRSNIPLLLLCLLIGPFLRFEAIYYVIICVGSIGGINYALLPKDISILKTFNKKQLTRISLFTLVFVIFTLVISLFNKSFHSPLNVLNVYSSKIPLYPIDSHIFVQFYSLLLYFKNLLLPFDANFFYPWKHWIDIHNSATLKIAVSLVPLTSIIISFFLFFRFKRQNSPYRFLSLGIFLFPSICLILSFRIRMDWYFQSRQYMATFFFLTCTFLFLKNYEQKFKKLPLILIAYLSLSLIFQLAFHYSSLKDFAIWEFSKHEYSSPQVQGYYAPHASLEEQQKMYQHAFNITNTPFIFSSLATRKHWLKSLFNGYLVSGKLNDIKSQNKIAEIITKSESYYGTTVCLAHNSIPLESCTTPRRKSLFCRTIRSGKARIHRNFKLRINPEKLCE